VTRPLRSGTDRARLDRLADEHGDPCPGEPDYRSEPLQQILEQQNEQADLEADVLPCGFYAGEHAFANPRCGCEPEGDQP
jgi:hypothetical protein